jgi:HD-like signal output (HDOD) protein
MASKLPDWIKAFTECEFPVLYESKKKIHDLQEDERDITVTILADIAKHDPGFSINLLRRAGLGSKKEVTTLSHAISLISIPLAIKMLTDLPQLEKVMDKRDLKKLLDIYAFQHHIACIAKQWAELRKESEINEIYTAAFNRGFFSFMLYSIDPDKARQVEQIYFSNNSNHALEEKKLLGHSVDEISEAISKNWSLPELIRESYSGKHHNPKITGIKLATEMMHYIYSHSSIHYPEEALKRIADYMRMNIEIAPNKLNRLLINSIRDGKQYLPYQPLLLILMSHPSEVKRKTQKKKTEIKVEPVVEENQKNTIFSDAIKLLQSKEQNKSAKELIEITMHALKEGVGFSRILFIPYDKKENCLDVKFEMLDKGLMTIKPLRVLIELNKLFSQLLKKEQTLCINPKNQHKFSHLLPEKLRPLKPNATIIINSFYVNKSITGCFYVDHGETNKQLTTNELKLFKIICSELKSALENNLQKKNPIKKVA